MQTGVRALSVEDRLRLREDVWTSPEEEHKRLPLPQRQEEGWPAGLGRSKRPWMPAPLAAGQYAPA